MKKNPFLPNLIFLLALLFCGALISCDSDISLSLSDSADYLTVNFSGECGPAFKEMLQASASGEEELFDTNEISKQLKASGFSDVTIVAKGTKLSLSMKDQGCKSYLFTSGLLTVSEDKHLKVKINQQKLKAFYDSSDEEIQLLLDLFLAPVFNDESMPADEYISMIGAVYGQGAQNEIAESKINFSVKPAAGKAEKKTLALADLLCGLQSEW